jgi:hypothetical protein
MVVRVDGDIERNELIDEDKRMRYWGEISTAQPIGKSLTSVEYSQSEIKNWEKRAVRDWNFTRERGQSRPGE